MTAALDYARRGWKVFPCHPDKRPATINGFKDASLDRDQIRTWWVDNEDYLIGIATGSGLLVIDLDSYKPGRHPEWDTFARNNGGMPETMEVLTGQGGHHYWFTVNQPVPCSTNLYPNVDVRGDGGYVIAAPGTSVYGEYELLRDVAPVPAPAWLLDEILVRKKVVAARSPVSSSVTPAEPLSPEEVSRCEQYATRAFELEVARLVRCREAAVPMFGRQAYSGEPWNAETYAVACNLLELSNSWWNSYTEEDAYRAVIGNAPRDSGFRDADVLERWNSARKKIGSNGRPKPPPQGGGLFIPYATPTQPLDPSAFFTKGEGLDVLRLATAVVEFGELAVDNTDNRSIWGYRSGVWAPSPHEVGDRCAVLLGSKFRPSHVSTVLPMIQQQCATRGDVITCEPVPEYVNCRNGMLHWATGQLYPHDPSFHSTVQLPVEWDPHATCPQFDVFAKEVMADDAIDYLWEIIGYLVFSGNPLQRAFLFHGSGINGKGTLIRVLKALLGQSNVSAVTLTDIAEARFEVASLHGKIANLAGDIDATYMKSTARFKAITGEDTIRAERKYEHGFAFQCWAVPVFSANEFWKSSDTTTGYKRRWQLLPFPNTFTVSGGQGLTDRLVSETPGILVKAVAGLQRLMARGDFDTPKSAQDEKDKFNLAADQVSEWLGDDVSVRTAEPGNEAVSYPSSEAYKAYRRWTEDSGNSPLPSSKWWQRMESLGYTRYKSGVMRVIGLQLDQRLLLVNHAQHSLN
jgi:P4 family phage/plasmid primase-like protien